MSALEHKGLTFPFGREGPAPGTVLPIRAGLHWARFPIPGPLRDVNAWLLDEPNDGLTVVDTGLDIPPVREAWDQLWAQPLVRQHLGRVVVTHFHPDHLGLAGELCARDGGELWMTRNEWLIGRLLRADAADAPPPEALSYWRLAGWTDEQVGNAAARGWRFFATYVSPIPARYRRMVAGETVEFGGARWRVVVSEGHSPEHLSLLDEAGGVFIAGDSALPRISPNVSLVMSEPDGDPLGDWLLSLDRLLELPGDVLILPSHGDPYHGLHARVRALRLAHEGRLDALAVHLAQPRRAVDCFGVLFGRAIDDGSRGLATGEALAHLRRLEVEGRARREMRDGVAWFGAA